MMKGAEQEVSSVLMDLEGVKGDLRIGVTMGRRCDERRARTSIGTIVDMLMTAVSQDRSDGRMDLLHGVTSARFDGESVHHLHSRQHARECDGSLTRSGSRAA
jgi:hypothetical protein